MEYRDLTPAELKDFVDYDDHEVIRAFDDPETGLKAFVAVHNTALGPALGGCRMFTYDSDKEAIRDVLRLSRGMTYKNALAGLPLGGGKSVIVGDSRKDKSETLIEAMGKAVHTFEGGYITAEDSGTNVQDMEVMARHTPYVMGRKMEGSQIGGDPSPMTAYGLFHAIKAAVRHRYGREHMKGLRVSVQGLGAVGLGLCHHLAEAGAALSVTDIYDKALDEARTAFENVEIVAPDEIFDVNADVFAPCAMGAQLNKNTIPRLKVDIVAGAANNQLETPDDAVRLADRGILYAPDYVVNAGGVISVAYEYLERTGENPFSHDITHENMVRHVEGIGRTMDTVFSVAEERGLTPGQAADDLAEALFKGEADTQSYFSLTAS